MLKNRLEKLVVPELKLIAKKIGIKGYSTVKKKELIELILTVEEDKILSALQLLEDKDDLSKEKDRVEAPKEKNGINWLKVLQNVTPLLILLVGFLTYLRGCEEPNPELCDVGKIEVFDDTDAFNIIILDFLDYTFCNAYAECEVEFQKRIDKINEYSHIPVNSKVTSCRSKDLNILNLDDAEEFCELKNADLVIFGAIENISKDSIRINLNYVTHPSVAPTIIDKTKNEKDFVVNSIFDISQSNHDFKEVEDIVNWYLAIKANNISDRKKVHEFVRIYLNKISDYNYKNHSNAKLLEGTSYINFEHDYDEAIRHFKSSIVRDSLNWQAYWGLSFAHMFLNNHEESVKNMQYSGFIRKYVCDSLYASLFDKDYTIYALLGYMDDSKEYCLGYSYVMQELLEKEEYSSFISEYFNRWERECGIDNIKDYLGDSYEYAKALSDIGEFANKVLDSMPKSSALIFATPTQEEFNDYMKRISSVPDTLR